MNTGLSDLEHFLQPSPRDLSSPGLLSAYTAPGLEGVIRQGIPGTSMPAWSDVLDDAQIASVIAYMDAVFARPRPRSP